jgi:hypothetical protein
MIHRQYVVKLDAGNEQRAVSDLDIIASLPGSYAAPVGIAANFAPGTVMTAPPVGWLGGDNWYYEIRSRALRIENLAGSAAFTPRTRLGGYLAIVPLADSTGAVTFSGLLPGVALSASLALNPIPVVALGTEIGAFADPNYGPVIRLRNIAGLYVGETTGAYFLVSLGLAENKDEDWANLGHA